MTYTYLYIRYSVNAYRQGILIGDRLRRGTGAAMWAVVLLAMLLLLVVALVVVVARVIGGSRRPR